MEPSSSSSNLGSDMYFNKLLTGPGLIRMAVQKLPIRDGSSRFMLSSRGSLSDSATYGRFVYRCGDKGCVAFNIPPGGYPAWPPFGDLLQKVHPSFKSIDWLSSEHPYRAYMTMYGIKESFISCLWVNHSTIPVVESERGFYKIHPDLLTSWRHIEVLIYGTIHSITSSNKCAYNLDFETPHSPSSYGYTKSWQKVEDVKKHAMQACFAFRDVLVYLTVEV